MNRNEIVIGNDYKGIVYYILEQTVNTQKGKIEILIHFNNEYGFIIGDVSNITRQELVTKYLNKTIEFKITKKISNISTFDILINKVS